MKLRNKKTGEMGIINHFDNQSIVIYPIDENWNAKGDKKYIYASLAELNADWEDYKEPKEYWYIDTYIYEINHLVEGANVGRDNFNKEIGNYFSSREEAEKAVEKLKAWTRLKDKGFKFGGYEIVEGNIHFIIDLRPLTPDDLFPDLDLLFSQEGD